MKKRLIAIILCVTMILSIPTFALAAVSAGNTYNVNKTVVLQSDTYSQRILVNMVNSANKLIEKLIKVSQFTPYDDVDFLIIMTQYITAPVFRYAQRIGAVVVCEYVEYYIDGRYVEIDPLRVISF